MNNLLAMLSLLLTLLITPFPTSAAVVYSLNPNNNAVMMSVQGVTVGKLLYDVEFADGTCVEVFGTCDGSSFIFKDQSTAALASTALLDQVFVDSDAGKFDSDPRLTNGCVTLECGVIIPYAANDFAYTLSYNKTLPFEDLDNPDHSLLPASIDTSTQRHLTWAKWTPSAAAIPEPGSLSLVAAAFIGVWACGFAASNARSTLRLSPGQTPALVAPHSRALDDPRAGIRAGTA